MNWSDITNDWPRWSVRLRNRFPRLEPDCLVRTCRDRCDFEAYLALTHDLSLTEAREEFEDFLYIETLAGELREPVQVRRAS